MRLKNLKLVFTLITDTAYFPTSLESPEWNISSVISCENWALFQALKVTFILCANQIWILITFYSLESHSRTNQIEIWTESNVNIPADNGICVIVDYWRCNERVLLFFLMWLPHNLHQCLGLRYTSVTAVSYVLYQIAVGREIIHRLHFIEWPMIFSHVKLLTVLHNYPCQAISRARVNTKRQAKTLQICWMQQP